MNFLPKNRVLILIVFGVVIIALLIGTIFWISSRKSIYFVVVEQDHSIKIDDPVIAETLEIGKVTELISSGAKLGKAILKLAIDKEINIPDKSYIEISRIQSYTKSPLEIKFVSSADYFQINDTIPLKSLTIEPGKTDSTLTVNQKSSTDSVSVKTDTKINIPKKKPADIEFFVQILTSEKELALKSKKFKGIEDVKMYKEAGICKYYVGKDLTIEGSIRLCEDLKNKGFADAFVIALKDYQRIPVKQALQLLEK